MPKSITWGPRGESRTLPGLRSRWTRSAPWIAASARARPEARTGRDCAGSGPWSRTASLRVGPGTYSVAIHGTPVPVSASRTAGVNGEGFLTESGRAGARTQNGKQGHVSACCGGCARRRPVAGRCAGLRARRRRGRSGPGVRGRSVARAAVSAGRFCAPPGLWAGRGGAGAAVGLPGFPFRGVHPGFTLRGPSGDRPVGPELAGAHRPQAGRLRRWPPPGPAAGTWRAGRRSRLPPPRPGRPGWWSSTTTRAGRGGHRGGPGRGRRRFTEIEHIGSTAVPGPAAEPVIDLMAAVPSLEDVPGHGPALARIGFTPHENGMTGRRPYVRAPGGVRTHILHVVASAGPPPAPPPRLPARPRRRRRATPGSSAGSRPPAPCWAATPRPRPRSSRSRPTAPGASAACRPDRCGRSDGEPGALGVAVLPGHVDGPRRRDHRRCGGAVPVLTLTLRQGLASGT